LRPQGPLLPGRDADGPGAPREAHQPLEPAGGDARDRVRAQGPLRQLRVLQRPGGRGRRQDDDLLRRRRFGGRRRGDDRRRNGRGGEELRRQAVTVGCAGIRPYGFSPQARFCTRNVRSPATATAKRQAASKPSPTTGYRLLATGYRILRILQLITELA